MRCKRYSTLPARIVIRGTNWVGDTIISLPAAKEMRRIFPHAYLAFWVKSGLAPLVQASGIADTIVGFGPDKGSALVRPFRMRSILNSGKFDMAVLFQNAFESAFTAWLARVPQRAGYATDLRGPLLTLKARMSQDRARQHQVYYYLGITEFLEQHFTGCLTPRTEEPDCSIPLDRSHVLGAHALLAAQGVEPERPMACLCPGSVNSEAKRWPADYFTRLADLLSERWELRIVFLGASDEYDLIEGICAQTRRAQTVNLAGKADMIQSMAIMGSSRIVISNDTGSAHLAVAASAKVLTIFGPTSAGATAPFGPTAHIIEGEAPCAPCRHFRCPLPDHPCMTGIPPEAILAKTEKILADETGL